MLRIAGQTAGPKFFVDTHGWPGGVMESKKKFDHFFSQFFLFFPTGNTGPFS